MSDEIFDNEEELGGDEVQGNQNRVGFLPSLVIQILKWAAIVLGAIIFIVTVVVVTLRILDTGNTTQTRVPQSEAYQTELEAWEYYGNIGQIQGRTADQVPNTFIVVPQLGYDGENRQLQTELINRTPQLRDLMRRYLTGKTADEMIGPDNEEILKAELLERINEIVSSGEVEDIVFDSFNVVEF